MYKFPLNTLHNVFSKGLNFSRNITPVINLTSLKRRLSYPNLIVLDVVGAVGAAVVISTSGFAEAVSSCYDLSFSTSMDSSKKEASFFNT